MERTEKRVLTLDATNMALLSMPLTKCETICWKKNAPPIFLTRFF